MMVELFKNGDTMAIRTDAKDERDFIDQIGEAFSKLIQSNRYEGDWEFQFGFWLPQVVDICCAYRNYKNTVTVRRQLIAGDYYPLPEHCVITIGEVKELEALDASSKNDSV